MLLSIIRNVLIGLAIAALASGCILPGQAWSWVFGEVLIFKSLIALRIALVGLSGVLTAIWYYMFSFPDREEPAPVDEEI